MSGARHAPEATPDAGDLPPTSALLAEDPPGAGDRAGRVRVTVHARLAYLKRIDVTEPHPADAIRRAWGTSDPVEAHPSARDAGDVRLIYEADRAEDETTILTVYREGGES